LALPRACFILSWHHTLGKGHMSGGRKEGEGGRREGQREERRNEGGRPPFSPETSDRHGLCCALSESSYGTHVLADGSVQGRFSRPALGRFRDAPGS
jgi:hypothetical protein